MNSLNTKTFQSIARTRAVRSRTRVAGGFRLALMASLLVGLSTQAAPLLNPIVAGAARPGTEGGGLSGSWYKVNTDARFSTYSYTETDPDSPRWNQTGPISSFSWATGIWSVGDIAALATGNNPVVTATASTLSAVSFANNIYNNTVVSGGFGSPWAPDYTRPLAPLLGGQNSCALTTVPTPGCALEENYAATFTGFVYIPVAGLYDFGVFADDGFMFSLLGAGGSHLDVGQPDLVGSSGRGFFSLAAAVAQGDTIELAQGFYGIDLSYFNRLQGGVIDLSWRGPADTEFTVIDPTDLYNAVPEPGTLALTALALAGLWFGRRTTRAQAPGPSPRSC